VIARATLEGLRSARRNPALVATLWLVNLALALAAALPGVRGLRDAIALLPGADPLAEAFSFGIVTDLAELRPGFLSGLGDAAIAVFGLGLLVGLLAAAGSLEVLASDDARPFAHRFGRGAFRFFGRFLRLGLVSLLAGLVLVLLLAGPFFALSRYARRELGSEWLALGLLLGSLLAAGLALLATLLVQDAARILLVRGSAAGVWRALRGGAARVLRRPVRWLGAWSLNAALLAAIFAAYLMLAGALPAGRLLLVVVLLQQLFVLLRCGMRVALLGAELELLPAEARPPQPPFAPELPSAPVPEAPPAAEPEPDPAAGGASEPA
jgi:hypothetical protein